MLRVRIDEGALPQPSLLWDSVWSPWRGQADWALADSDETQNRGGLRAKWEIGTAVTLALFTDKRIEKTHPLYYLVDDKDDQRGWWGDGVDVRDDLFETELGSLLWVFERSILTQQIGRWVEVITKEALAPLITQGLCVRVDAAATVNESVNRLDLEVKLYGRDGALVYDQRFADVWARNSRAPRSPVITATPP